MVPLDWNRPALPRYRPVSLTSIFPPSNCPWMMECKTCGFLFSQRDPNRTSLTTSKRKARGSVSSPWSHVPFHARLCSVLPPIHSLEKADFFVLGILFPLFREESTIPFIRLPDNSRCRLVCSFFGPTQVYFAQASFDRMLSSFFHVAILNCLP